FRVEKNFFSLMGHLGLTPQSIYKFGTYTVRAKEEEEAQQLIENAKLLEDLGCFAMVLEKIPAKLAKKVAEMLTIPTIGIGAGSGTDGQVLVVHDMMGMTKDFQPRFIRRYLELYELMLQATTAYIEDVKAVQFPNQQEQY
ncbi:MAG: 3-methyl-2-oxobutanoate hydroxymethyltransferase, partial [Saprospiraceae bacterium]|nr:3-methyl-2-oxobutanoate hydroxymethyltransferase [Saprospiraceae bacterium]